VKRSFKEFLAEGGWSSTLTQDVILTPALAKKALALLPRFEKDFNAHLAKKNLAPVAFGKPVGSSAYIERDLKSNPDKEYGDIDVMFIVPRIEGMKGSDNWRLYREELDEYIDDNDLSYLAAGTSFKGAALVFQVGDQAVQIDLVKSFTDLEDWTSHRMTPEHGVKGALIGFLYSSLAEVLNLSIGDSGVQMKEKGGEVVSFRTLKADKLRTLSTSIDTFATDILKAFHERDGEGKVKISKGLAAHPGITKSEIKIADLASAIKGLGESFALNDMYSKGLLKHISSQEDFLSKVRETYIKKNEDLAKSSKFDKAQTDRAKQKAAETQDMLRAKSAEIAKLL
jgi:hypothetical protein